MCFFLWTISASVAEMTRKQSSLWKVRNKVHDWMEFSFLFAQEQSWFVSTSLYLRLLVMKFALFQRASGNVTSIDVRQSLVAFLQGSNVQQRKASSRALSTYFSRNIFVASAALISKLNDRPSNSLVPRVCETTRRYNSSRSPSLGKFTFR